MPASYRVRISRTAEGDVGDVWRFISQENAEAAATFLLQLEERISTLERFPERCPLIPENDLIGTKYRHLVYGDYRMIFRIDGRLVHVLRIFHAARLLDASGLENY